MSAPKSPMEILRNRAFHVVFQADDNADVKTNAVSSDLLANEADKAAVTLERLRVLGKLSPKYYFCLPGDKSKISESTSLGSYVSSIKSNIDALRAAETDNMTALLKLYHRSNAVVDPKAELESQALSTQPAEMTEHEWNVVLLDNSLLHGLIFDPESQTFQVAREPAFKLKKAHSDRYRRPAGSSGGLQASDSDDNGDFLAPDFCVADDSSVTITSVRNSLQKSMTEHSFSSWSVEASASGGFGGFSGGASASGGQTSEDISKVAKTETTDLMHTSYNFPRVKVFLDGNDVEHSDSCKEFCKEQPVDVAKFHQKYGTIFSSSVVLGARLHSTVASSTFLEVKATTTKDEKKAAFALSFSSPFASGSGGGSYDSKSEKDDKAKQEKDSKNLNWEARGGETFLATDPTAWINTVGLYQNWRVVERGDVRNVLDVVLPTPLISAFVGFECKLGFPNKRIRFNNKFLVECPSPYAPGITLFETGKGWLDVSKQVAGSGVVINGKLVWEVKTTSRSDRFHFCISDSRNSTKLAMEILPSRQVVVNPFDPTNPDQIVRLIKVNDRRSQSNEATQGQYISLSNEASELTLELTIPVGISGDL